MNDTPIYKRGTSQVTREALRQDFERRAEVDLLDAFNRMLLGYQEMYQNPPSPKPMVVPSWLPGLCEKNGIDLDAYARDWGFDGYVTPKLWT